MASRSSDRQREKEPTARGQAKRSTLRAGRRRKSQHMTAGGETRFRKWRNAKIYKDEGWDCVAEMNSEEMFGLNHRFYLHYDDRGRMWLSAEDGCEGTPSEGSGGLLGRLGDMLLGR